MKITHINVLKIDGDRLRAYVSVIFDHSFIIKDLKIISGNNGLFVQMPSKKTKDGTYKDIAHPLNQKMRYLIEQKIIHKYYEQIQKS